MVERRSVWVRIAGFNPVGQRSLQVPIWICNGRRADHHQSSRICYSVEETVAGSSAIDDGRAKTIAGSAGIYNSREIIIDAGKENSISPIFNHVEN